MGQQLTTPQSNTKDYPGIVKSAKDYVELHCTHVRNNQYRAGSVEIYLLEHDRFFHVQLKNGEALSDQYVLYADNRGFSMVNGSDSQLTDGYQWLLCLTRAIPSASHSTPTRAYRPHTAKRYSPLL